MPFIRNGLCVKKHPISRGKEAQNIVLRLNVNLGMLSTLTHGTIVTLLYIFVASFLFSVILLKQLI